MSTFRVYDNSVRGELPEFDLQDPTEETLREQAKLLARKARGVIPGKTQNVPTIIATSDVPALRVRKLTKVIVGKIPGIAPQADTCANCGWKMNGFSDQLLDLRYCNNEQCQEALRASLASDRARIRDLHRFEGMCVFTTNHSSFCWNPALSESVVFCSDHLGTSCVVCGEQAFLDTGETNSLYIHHYVCDKHINP